MALPLGRATRSEGVTLKFGSMIALAVTVYGAVAEDKESKLSTACKNGHDLTKPKQHMICPICQAGAPGTPSAYVKAQERGGLLIEMREEDIAAANQAELEYYNVIDVQPHWSSEVSSLLQPSGKSYYLNVESAGTEPLYALLAEMIRNRPDVAFMAKFTLKTAVSVFRLVVAGENTIVLQQQARPELVRAMPVITSEPADPVQLQLASTLVDALITPFDPDALKRERNLILAAAAAGQVGVAQPELATVTAGVMDLTSAMKAALAAATQPVPEAAPAAKVAPERAARKAS